MPEDDVDPTVPDGRKPAGETRPRVSLTGPRADVGDDDARDDEDAADPAPRRRRRTPVWAETGILLVVALVMALVIKTFFVQAFYIPSQSMEPGLRINDRILVQKVSYWFGGSPDRGDVIVFEDPGGWLTGPEPGPQTWLAKGLAKVGLYPTGGHLVKRVIGIGGDTVVCCDDQGRIEVNGHPLDEHTFIRKQPTCDGPMVNGCTSDWSVTVPPDKLFVMGDNRGASADSSAHLCQEKACDRAFVPVRLVVGKVFALVWPLKHARFIGDPKVFDDVPDPT